MYVEQGKASLGSQADDLAALKRVAAADFGGRQAGVVQ